MNLYEYACYFVPTEAQKTEGFEPTIIEIDNMLAVNEEEVRRRVVFKLDNKYEKQLGQLTILVRLFR